MIDLRFINLASASFQLYEVNIGKLDLIITRLLEKFFNEELELVHRDKPEIGNNNFVSVKMHILTSQSYITIVKLSCHFIPKQIKQLVSIKRSLSSVNVVKSVKL